ncbi:unnamed protein product [Miscanthus lutarioriparius]|uniref:Uncharacterized protein n=1 Tax=Miscanthus lutarioriparius TaxID=422564 RepID=A0A811QIK3_9POAL|nr:unnamed protein product [Miscanthus lutarioriparius]
MAGGSKGCDESSADQLLLSGGQAGDDGEDDAGGADVPRAGHDGSQAIAARWSWMKSAGTAAGSWPPAPRRPRCGPTSGQEPPPPLDAGAPPLLPPRRRQARRPRPCNSKARSSTDER